MLSCDLSAPMEGFPWRMTCCLPLIVSFSLFVGGAHKHEGKTRRYQVPFESTRVTPPWSEPFVRGPVSPERSFPVIQSPRTSEQPFTAFVPSGMASSQPEQFAGNQMGSTATTVPIVPNEMFSDTTDNRDEMNPESFSYLDGQLSSGASSNSEYFESAADLNSTDDDSGPTREEMDVIRPFIDSDNKLAQAIINDTWAQDKELTSSRQAVSEGLVTSHVLANADMKTKPVVKQKPRKKISNNGFQANAFSSSTGHYAFLPLSYLNKPTIQFSNPNHEQENLTSTTHLEKMKNKTSQKEFKLHDHSFSLKPSQGVSVNLEKVGGGKPSASDLRNDWFTIPKPSLSNKSKENATTSNFSSGQHDKTVMKTLSAADYLKTLYPQLSIFKAPFKVDEKQVSDALSVLEKLQLSLSASKNSTSPNKLPTFDSSSNSSATKASVLLSSPSSSVIHSSSSSLLPANKTLATRKEITAEASRRFNEETSGFSKNSSETRMKIKDAFLKFLLKLHPTVRPASASVTNVSLIKNTEIQRYISSLSPVLITRNKNRGRDKSSYRYLTEAGAKLLPGHIFSPLGSDFSDGLEPTPVPSPGTSIPKTVSSVRRPINQMNASSINPTQTGSIPAETKTNYREVSLAPAIIPTQSGRIQTDVSRTSGQTQTEVVTETPTETLPEVSGTTKKLASPTSSTTIAKKTSTNVVIVPTQAGFIETHPQTPKTTLPTKKGLYVPTTIDLMKRRDRAKNDINTRKRTRQNKATSLHNNLSTNYETMRRRAFERGEVETKHLQFNMETPDRHFHQHKKERQVEASWRRKSRLFENPFAGSLPARARVRRQMFVPVPLMQANSLNAQQYNQPLMPAQQLIPNLVPAQLPPQQFIPTQPVQPFLPQVALPLAPLSPFVQPDLRSQFPFQQLLDQRSLAAQTQDSLIPFGAPPSPPMAASNQMPNAMPVSMNQIQQMFPNQAPQNVQSYSQREMRPIQPAASLSPVTVNVPLPPPQKIPSFLAASEVYKDFQDVNSKSHLEDDILANPLSQGEYASPEDDLKEEQKYNNYAYESDKKNWDTDNDLPDEEPDIATVEESKGRNLHYTSDELNDDNSLAEQSDFDERRPMSSLRYVTGGRRHHRPKHHHHKHHWTDEDSFGTRVNSKGIIGHKEGKIVEISDGKFHPAEETTENAFKDSPYKTSTESDQQEDQLPSDDENLWASQLEKSSPTDGTDAFHSEGLTGINQSEPNESDEDINTNQPESSNGENQSSEIPLDDKNERHEELRDGSEDAAPDEGEGATASSAPVTFIRQAMSPSLTSWKEELVNKLSRSAVMHLTFDDAPVKAADETVQDKSGNENDAVLQNGAQISNRTMGTCGRVVILKEGEVIYKADKFTKKPTKAASIAMWVKSRKPGLVRWFDVGNNGVGSPAQKSSESGKLVKVPRNQWIHLAGTFDSRTGVARVYANGRLISETIGQKNQGLPEDFTATGIGQKFGDKFISFLDDVYMFDRVISPTEVKMLYKKCEFNRMILHFGFQNINTTTHQVMDQSGLDNNGTIKGGAHTLNSGCDKCGACLDASSGDSPGVYLDGRRFHHKPTAAISVSSWVSLNKTKGQHSIFQVVSNKNDEWHEIYILEVIDGRLHWASKNARGDRIFDVKTDEIVIPEGLWSHVTATYNSESGQAKVFVNGLLKSSYTDYNKSKLSDAWGRVTIGGHLPDAKPFEGLLDEFFVYNWELDPSEVRFVLKYCADRPKLVSFTVRVPLFKRQRIAGGRTRPALN